MCKKVKQEWFDETPEYDEANLEVYKPENKRIYRQQYHSYRKLKIYIIVLIVR